MDRGANRGADHNKCHNGKPAGEADRSDRRSGDEGTQKASQYRAANFPGDRKSVAYLIGESCCFCHI